MAAILYVSCAPLVSWALQNEKPPHYEAFAIGFSVDGVLSHLAARWLHGDPLNYYKGLLWGEVGRGSRVAMVTKHCEIEFDPGDEVFYPTEQQFAGLSIGGGERGLEKEPDQRIAYIRVALRDNGARRGR